MCRCTRRGASLSPALRNVISELEKASPKSGDTQTAFSLRARLALFGGDLLSAQVMDGSRGLEAKVAQAHGLVAVGAQGHQEEGDLARNVPALELHHVLAGALRVGEEPLHALLDLEEAGAEARLVEAAEAARVARVLEGEGGELEAVRIGGEGGEQVAAAKGVDDRCGGDPRAGARRRRGSGGRGSRCGRDRHALGSQRQCWSMVAASKAGGSGSSPPQATTRNRSRASALKSAPPSGKGREASAPAARGRGWWGWSWPAAACAGTAASRAHAPKSSTATTSPRFTESLQSWPSGQNRASARP